MRRLNQNGVVLPSILWITVLVLVIASSFAADVRVSTRTLDNIKGNVALKQDSVAGIYVALARMLEQRISDRLDMEYRINQHVIDVEVLPENSKTDVNSASLQQLARVLVEHDWDPDQALSLAARIVDWRDGDRERHDLGMEDSDYFALGKPYGAKDRRIDDLIELKLMARLEHEDFARLTRFLTVYGRGAGSIFTIVATAQDAQAERSFVTSATVQLTYRPGKPYRVIRWRYNQV